MSKSVNQKQLAEIIGITDRQVRRLEEQEIIQKNGHGEYDLTSCLDAYYQYKYRPPTNADYDKEHALLEKVKREKAEIELQKIKNEVHDAADVEFALTNMVVTFKTRILGLPYRLAPLILGKTNLEEVIEILIKAIKGELNELSDYSPTMFTEGEDNESENP